MERQYSSIVTLKHLTISSDATQLENGGFAEYIVAKGDVQIKTPDNVTDEEAATLGISIATVVSVDLTSISHKC
jgi:NADPH:quinone reductase-like Zn-dependent oxidoreductase